MYTAINFTAKTSITTTSKSTLCKFIGIDPTTLWRRLGKSSYLEYKEYIIVSTEVVKQHRKNSYKHLRTYSDRFKQINHIMNDENMQ
jgi:hypothetical protein